MGISDRKEREKRQRRDQILEAAETLFKSKGFDGTSMSDIAEAVELGPSTLYLYFPNKEVLHAAVSLKILSRMLERIESQANAGKQSPYKKINTLKEVMFNYYESDKSILLNVFHFQTSPLIRDLSPEIKAEMEELTRPAFQSMKSIFQEGIDQGCFKARNPAALADIFWGLFAGLVIYEENKTALNPKKGFMKETFDLAYEIFIEGLKKKER